MKAINQVFMTNDYAVFGTIKGNRRLNKLHSKRLERSFSEKHLMSPIIVNDAYQVIDGQHRLSAAKALGLPVYFIVCPGYGIDDVHRLNTNMSNWKRQEYLSGYCELGYPEYLKFYELLKEYPQFGFNAMLSLAILSSVSKSMKDRSLASESNKTGTYGVKFFEEGELVIPDIKKTREYANKILEIHQYYENATQYLFVMSMIGIFKNPNYDHDIFMSKLSRQPGALYDCRNAKQFRELIEDVYNHRNRNKVNLRF